MISSYILETLLKWRSNSCGSSAGTLCRAVIAASSFIGFMGDARTTALAADAPARYTMNHSSRRAKPP